MATAGFWCKLNQIVLRLRIATQSSKGVRTFLPMEGGTQKREGRFASTLKPMFLGYMFVSFNIARGLWRKVHSTYGITCLVSFGKKPAAVPLDIVSKLMLRCDNNGKLLPLNILSSGDRLRFNSGPFADIVVMIEHIAPDRRVWVLMDIMGSQARVAVGADQLQPV
ncbi:MAG: transcription termination/antitermination NusG family protein [Marinomonas sp.]